MLTTLRHSGIYPFCTEPMQSLWLLQIIIAAFPGVVVGTILTALVCVYILPYGWNWSESLLVGSILSATDPVAVVALLKSVSDGWRMRA